LIAFVTFIKTFGLWIYSLCALGILLGFKMLYDARSLSRTTLFTMDRERAVEQTQRGLLLIAVMAVIVFFVTFVSVVIAPFLPQPESLIARGVTPTVANIFPTTANTLTASPTQPQPTETPFITGTPAPPPVVPSNTPAPFATRPTPSLVITSTLLLAPVLVYERNKDPLFNGLVVTGESAARNSLIFKWDWTCDKCVMTPNDKFVITVNYFDKLTGLPKSVGGSTALGVLAKTITLYDILAGQGGEHYQKARDDLYTWNVQVKRVPGDQPISAPSETWRFTWH
jgi:hypothetical protein